MWPKTIFPFVPGGMLACAGEPTATNPSSVIPAILTSAISRLMVTTPCCNTPVGSSRLTVRVLDARGQYVFVYESIQEGRGHPSGRVCRTPIRRLATDLEVRATHVRGSYPIQQVGNGFECRSCLAPLG